MSVGYSKLLLVAIMLVTGGIFATISTVNAENPAIFIQPSAVIGDLTPTPGSVTQWSVNVSNIGEPGLISHEFYVALDPVAFPEYYPIGNMNFTANANGWTTTQSGTGTPTYGWDGADGNPAGSGVGSYYLRATSTSGAIASLTFLTEYSFTWSGLKPLDGGAIISFAYKISGNSIYANGVTMMLIIVKPDASTSTQVSKTYSATRPWSYNSTFALQSALDQAGTYKLRLRTVLRTALAGVGNYVQFNWDDVGLMLARVSAKEGPFLTSDPGNVGDSTFSAKYVRSGGNHSLYIAGSLKGIPWTDMWPVQGGGTIAYFNVTASYGAGRLDLWGTVLLQPTLVPPYTPVEISPHDAMDAYFDNRIPGDIAGPENPPGSGLYPYDAKVNRSDLIYLRTKYGTNDAKADFTGPENPPGSGTYPPDGIVNVRDLRGIGKNYGRTYP